MHYVIEFICQGARHKVVRMDRKEAEWIYCELERLDAARELTRRETLVYEQEEGHNFSVLPSASGGQMVVLWDLEADHPQCL